MLEVNRPSSDFIECYGGGVLYPLDPDPSDIRIEDIAHALALMNRYNGHTQYPWSVAAHSVWVAELVPPEHKLVALLHDATEAYLPDVCRPVKKDPRFSFFEEYEGRVWSAICDAFALDSELPEIVKMADRAMLWHEANALMSKPLAPWWGKWKVYADLPQFSMVEVRVQEWDWTRSETVFLKAFRHYWGAR